VKTVQSVVCVGLLAGCSFGAAHAGYILLPTLPSGADSVIDPGEIVRVNVVLTDDTQGAAPVHNSAIFRVIFSVEGFEITSVQWASPYVGGGAFDDSTPGQGGIPFLLTNDTLNRPGDPVNTADFELSNVVPTGTFGVGQIASFTFRVPTNPSSDRLLIDLAPDTFANGFSTVQTQVGPRLLFAVVPTPGAAGLLAAGGIMVVRSRRGTRVA
jgi:hypothetical protein